MSRVENAGITASMHLRRKNTKEPVNGRRSFATPRSIACSYSVSQTLNLSISPMSIDSDTSAKTDLIQARQRSKPAPKPAMGEPRAWQSPRARNEKLDEDPARSQRVTRRATSGVRVLGAGAAQPPPERRQSWCGPAPAIPAHKSERVRDNVPVTRGS